MRTITVEELSIVVQASVEQALTEFKKIVPQLKKTIKQVEDNLNNVDTKGMTDKVQKAVQQVKKKVNEVKNTGVDKQLQSQFDKAGASVQKYQGQLDQVKEKLRQVYAEMDSIQANTWKQYTPVGVEIGNQAIEPTVNNALGDVTNERIEGIEAAVNTFYNSLASNFNYTGYNSNVMDEYVPAVVFTSYDGYYIYSPYNNVLTDVPDDQVDTSYSEKGELTNGLKPYVSYSSRYKTSNIDIVITYTLGNYITIQGTIGSQYVYDYGYL